MLLMAISFRGCWLLTIIDVYFMRKKEKARLKGYAMTVFVSTSPTNTPKSRACCR